MLNSLKHSFVWQFAAGFVLGAVGLVVLQPAPARHQLAQHLHVAAPIAAHAS